MAQTIGVAGEVPQGWVRCTSQRCEYVGSAPQHAHPQEEGAKLRLGCGVVIDRAHPLNWQAEAFVIAMMMPVPLILSSADRAHHERKIDYEAILRTALAYVVQDALVFQEV